MKQHQEKRDGNLVRLGFAYRAASYCIDVLRRFLVVADAPAVADWDHFARDAILENVKVDRLTGHGPDGYLYNPLQEAERYARDHISNAADLIKPFAKSEFSTGIDAWSESCHELAGSLLRELQEHVSHRVDLTDELIGDPYELDSKLLEFIREKWRFRNVPLEQIGKLLLDEYIAASDFLREQSKQSTEVPDDDGQAVQESLQELADAKTPPRGTEVGSDVRPADSGSTPPTGKKPKRSTGPVDVGSDADAASQLLSVFTNGLADERLVRAEKVLRDDKLTVNDKLTKIDELIPFPPTVSGASLGKMLGVSKQAVMKTEWWIRERKGEKQNEIGRRRGQHRERAKQHQPNRNNDDED